MRQHLTGACRLLTTMRRNDARIRRSTIPGVRGGTAQHSRDAAIPRHPDPAPAGDQPKPGDRRHDQRQRAGLVHRGHQPRRPVGIDLRHLRRRHDGLAGDRQGRARSVLPAIPHQLERARRDGTTPTSASCVMPNRHSAAPAGSSCRTPAKPIPTVARESTVPAWCRTASAKRTSYRRSKSSLARSAKSGSNTIPTGRATAACISCGW